MWFLIVQKTKVGNALDSKAILADAACSRVCIYLSLVLMTSSILFELTGIGALDAVGAVVIAWLSFREGKESFENSNNLSSCSCSCTCKGKI